MEKTEVLDNWCMLPEFDEYTMKYEEFENWEETKKSMDFEKDFLMKCETLKENSDKIENDPKFVADIEKLENGDVSISENGLARLKKLGFSFSFLKIKSVR